MILSISALHAQGRFDRRIIIRDSTMYAVEIKDQIGVLWICKTYDPLDSAAQYILPAGTKRRTIFFQPFAWDLYKDTIYAVNFTENMQNDRMTSLKSIPLSGLKRYTGKEQLHTAMLQAAFENGSIENLPLVNAVKEFTYMDALFFDVTKTDDAMYMGIAVDSIFRLWKYTGSWQVTQENKVERPFCFDLCQMQDKVVAIGDKGMLLSPEGINTGSKGSDAIEIAHMLLVEDEDTGMLYFLPEEAFNETSVSFEQIKILYKIPFK
ncbi:MAG: hypothetical protein R2794_02540 [Chitinophagales bacterium]